MLASGEPGVKRAMNDKIRQNGQRAPEEEFSEFGEVRVISKPAPDAEDRLRRLFTLLLRPPASDGEAASGQVSRPDARRNDSHRETEA